MKKIISILALTAAVAFGYYYWLHSSPSSTHQQTKNESKPLKIGVTAGPHLLILEFVQMQAEKAGLLLEVVEFNDFILPNEALNREEIDLNCYQHAPFLEEQIASRGYDLINVAKTVLMPMGIYSQKILNLKELPQNSKVGIPNDPTNAGRSLILLNKAGLITLKNSKNPSVLDIVENPRNLKIIELEAPHLPRALSDLDIAVINTDWVLLAKMDPQKALYKEDINSPYTNIIAVKKGHENHPGIKQFIDLYHSDATKQFINETFKGAVIAGW